ncbi:MAG: PEP-CTERM sorting domain-containing protein, partial [Armatimonadetes bacterium]|nr:PEP-CTERM sorting domain-containing protein [Armatimonadota bacterium]
AAAPPVFNPAVFIPAISIFVPTPHGGDRSNPVPEPCSMVALGGLALAAVRRRRKA